MSQEIGSNEKRINVEYFEGVNSLVSFNVAKKTELYASENARSVNIGSIEKRGGQTVIGKAVGGTAFTTNNNYGIFYFNPDIATNQGLYRLSEAATANKATLFYLSEAGVVTAVTLKGGGTGYTTGTGVATTGGSGSGCTVNITASGGVISAITVNAGGTGYANGETLTVSTGGANATFIITTVNAWTPLTGKGAGILAGMMDGTQAEENYYISNYADYNRYISGDDGTTVYDSADAAGHLYNSPKAQFINYYKNRLYLANFKQEKGTVNGATIISGGTGYSNGTAVATTGGSGTGLTVDITTSTGVITVIAINAVGSGYKENETITVSGGGANATFTISTNQTVYPTTVLRSSFPLGIISLISADNLTPSGTITLSVTDTKYLYTATGAKEYEVYRGPNKVADISLVSIQDTTVTCTYTFSGSFTTFLASDEIWVSGTYTGPKKFRWVNNGSITGRDVKQYDTFKLSGGDNDGITMMENIGNVMMIANKNSLSSWNDYTLENFDLGIGNVSKKGNVKLLGSLYFLHYTGIYSTSGGIPKLISNKVERYINGATKAGKETCAAGKKGRSVFFTLGDVTLYYPDGSIEKTLRDVCLEYSLTQENWFVHTNVKASEFTTFVSELDSDRLVFIDTAGNKAVKSFLEGSTDDGSEIFFRIDLNKMNLQGNYENTNTLNSLIIETERGSSLKAFVSTAEGNPSWYEIDGTATKGVSLLKITSKDPERGQAVPCRTFSLSLRDSSLQSPKIIRLSVIYLPGTVNDTNEE